MCSIRGAITVENNSRESILDNTRILLEEIILKNEIKLNEIESILFTATKDLTKAYPAESARSLGITHAGLMCLQEQYVEGSLEMCVRVMMSIKTCKEQSDVRHIYLKDAKKLRPDLINNA